MRVARKSWSSSRSSRWRLCSGIASTTKPRAGLGFHGLALVDARRRCGGGGRRKGQRRSFDGEQQGPGRPATAKTTGRRHGSRRRGRARKDGEIKFVWGLLWSSSRQSFCPARRRWERPEAAVARRHRQRRHGHLCACLLGRDRVRAEREKRRVGRVDPDLVEPDQVSRASWARPYLGRPLSHLAFQFFLGKTI